VFDDDMAFTPLIVSRLLAPLAGILTATIGAGGFGFMGGAIGARIGRQAARKRSTPS